MSEDIVSAFKRPIEVMFAAIDGGRVGFTRGT